MNLNRRNFLVGMGAVVGGLALEEAIPLGRIWSFPSNVKSVNVAMRGGGMVYYVAPMMDFATGRAFSLNRHAFDLSSRAEIIRSVNDRPGSAPIVDAETGVIVRTVANGEDMLPWLQARNLTLAMPAGQLGFSPQ